MSFKDIFYSEIKSLMKNKVFYAFIVVVAINILTNYNTDISRLDPVEEGGYYGYTYSQDQGDILSRGYELLTLAYQEKRVIRYLPLATFKDLSDNQLKELEDFLLNMSSNKIIPSAEKDDFIISTDDMFAYMEKLDNEVGGNTLYADKEYFYSRPVTYEEELKKREKIKSQDKHTRAYARLFSDYNGIGAALFVVFIVVISLFSDIKSGKKDIYYSLDTKASNYIFAKFCGLLIAIMGVFISFALIETIFFVFSALKNGQSIDIFAFIWTTIIWITPTVMFSIALPFLVYTAFDKFSLSLISGILMSSYMLMTTELYGDYSLSRLIIRFNSLSPYEDFAPFREAILINRGFYILLSIACLYISTYLWKMRKHSVLASIEL